MKGFFVDPPKRRYSDKTYIAAVKRRDEKDYGPLFTAKDLWSEYFDSLLIEHFLNGWPLVGRDRCLVRAVKRSRRAVETRLWKIAIHYHGMNESRVNNNRTDRTEQPLSERDLYIIGLATGPGGKRYGACSRDTRYVAAVLGRTREDTLLHLQGIVKPYKGFFVEKKRDPSFTELVDSVGKALAKETNNFAKKYFVKD